MMKGEDFNPVQPKACLSLQPGGGSLCSQESFVCWAVSSSKEHRELSLPARKETKQGSELQERKKVCAWGRLGPPVPEDQGRRWTWHCATLWMCIPRAVTKSEKSLREQVWEDIFMFLNEKTTLHGLFSGLSKLFWSSRRVFLKMLIPS